VCARRIQEAAIIDARYALCITEVPFIRLRGQYLCNGDASLSCPTADCHHLRRVADGPPELFAFFGEETEEGLTSAATTWPW
jgi:hypothetical protein